MRLRVLSYNIHKGIGGRDRRYRLERILAVLDHEAPDVVCLQEVDRHVGRTRGDHQAELIAQHFRPAASLFQLTHRIKTGGYGNLLLSKWTFREHHQISLSLRSRKARGAQWAILETGQGPLRVVNWHLGLAERERHWQVRRLLEHHLFVASNNVPTVIIGDTNDWRNTLARGPFLIHGYHHVTAPPSRYRTFPAYFPLGSLDKAFTRGVHGAVHARAAHSRLTRDASDHLPLVVDLDWPIPPGE